MQPAVSVIIPTRNGQAWLADQLTALTNQDFTGSWEVVLVDNGSTDDTVALAKSFIPTFPVPLRIVDASGKAGISHARNSGASAALGKLLAFCDCDDQVSKGWVTAAHQAGLKAEIVAGLNRELRYPLELQAPKLNPGGVIKGKTINAFIGCNFAVNRDAYFAIGGFDESLPPYGCDDMEFSIRADNAGFHVVGSEDMLVFFRKTTGTGNVLRKVYLSAKAEVVLWYRHLDRFQDQVGLRRSLLALLRLPLDLLRHPSSSLRTQAREVVTRWGHLVGNLEWQRGRYHQTAQLLPIPSEPAK